MILGHAQYLATMQQPRERLSLENISCAPVTPAARQCPRGYAQSPARLIWLAGSDLDMTMGTGNSAAGL
jgi:hypothetical protein